MASKEQWCSWKIASEEQTDKCYSTYKIPNKIHSVPGQVSVDLGLSLDPGRELFQLKPGQFLCLAAWDWIQPSFSRTDNIFSGSYVAAILLSLTLIEQLWSSITIVADDELQIYT